MPAPASRDLRQRVVEAYVAGEGSLRDLATDFQVHFNSVARWVKRFRRTGSVDPAPHGGGRPKKIPESARKVLRELVKQQPDATLAELSERLEAQTGIVAAPPRVCEALLAMDVPRKNRVPTRASSTAPMSRSSGPSSPSRRRA